MIQSIKQLNHHWIDVIHMVMVILNFLRFMADTNVVGCNWIELPKNKYRVRSDEKGNNSISYLHKHFLPLLGVLFS